MTITYVIPGATLLNQLGEPTMDGQPDEDARDNCVAASIAEALHILTGKAFDGDELHDAVYGQGYIGFQSASRYVSYCHDQGVTLAPHDGSQADLVATIHSEVAAGHPVLVTMPSQWGTPYSDPVHPSGSTHVGVAIGCGVGEIRVMNPWGGFWQDQPDSWWEPRLCEGQVWPMMKASGSMWHQVSASPLVMADSNGIKAIHGMAQYLSAHATLGDVVKGCGGETYVDNNTSVLPLQGDVSLVYLVSDETVHSDQTGAVLWALYQRLLSEQSAEASASDAAGELQAQLTAAQQQVASLTAQLAGAASQIAQLQQELTAAQQQPALTPAQQAAVAAVAALKTALGS